MNWLALVVTTVMGLLQPGASPAPAPPPAAPPAPEAAEFEKQLESVDAAIAKIADLRADFEQTRRTPLLKKPLTSSGVIRCKGELVRWDTTKPRESSLLISKSRIRVYYPGDKLVEEYPVDESLRDVAGAPLPRLTVLKARFEIAALSPKDLGETGDKNLLAVLLTPRSKELRRHVATVKVLIDLTINAATKVVMTDADGEVTEVSFRNVKINTGLTTEEVDPPLPEGVRVSRPLGEPKAAEPANDSPAGPKKDAAPGGKNP